MNRMKRMHLPAWFTSYVSRYKRSVTIALVLGLVGAGCSALLMFTSGYLIDATAMPGITLFAVMIPVACVQLFGFGRPLARYLERLVSHDWVLKVTSDLRLALYRSVERRTGDPAQARAVGEYLGILQDDIAHLQNLYLRVVFPTAIALLLAVAASLMLGFFSIPFALVMLLVFVLTAGVLPFATLLATHALATRAKALKEDEFTALADDVMGATDWALSGRSFEAIAAHAAHDSEMRKMEARIRMTQRGMSLAGTLMLGAAACLVTVWAGNSFGTVGVDAVAAMAATDGSGTAAAAAPVNLIGAFVLGFFPLIEAFAAVPAAVSAIPVHESAIARLDEYLGDGGEASVSSAEGRASIAAVRVDGGEEPLAPSTFLGAAGQAFSSDKRAEGAGVKGICLDGVSYSYPCAAKRALDGVSLQIASGEKVAVLGRSGSGKTTLVQLMRGTLEPVEGEVFVCGRSVADIAADIARYVGFIGQTPYLFNRPLRENLTLGVAAVDDEVLVRALSSVGLGAKLESLPNGLDTVIGETGVGLSGGEAHRVALARVMVADTPVVLVDEPFAAVDPETEKDLIDALFKACENRTLVVVTHHLAQIERFDRVVFVEDGKIDLEGSPTVLRDTSPRFRQLLDFDRAL